MIEVIVTHWALQNILIGSINTKFKFLNLLILFIRQRYTSYY